MSKLADPSNPNILRGMAPIEWGTYAMRSVPMSSLPFDGPWTEGATQLDGEILPRSEDARRRKTISGNMRWLMSENFWSVSELI